jgi:hypothetical protein
MSVTVTQLGPRREGPAVKALAALAVVGFGLLNAQAAVARGVPAAGPGAPACSVTWTGQGAQPQWTIPQNWSTGAVPGPTSDVCVDNPTSFLHANVSIAVHSLQVSGAALFLDGTAGHPLTATVATSISLPPGSGNGGTSKIYLTDASIHAGRINDTSSASFINSISGTNRIVSPNLVVSNFGWLTVQSGKLTVTSFPSLANGTLSGTIQSQGTLVLPGDVTRFASARVDESGPNPIQDASGHNALAGLTSIDAQSTLDAPGTDLALNGSLTSSAGDISLGALTVNGTCTLEPGTPTSLTVGTLRAKQVVISKDAILGANAVTGTVVNSGTVLAPGTVTGSYTQSSSGSLAVAGGPLAVTGKATLSGSVEAGGALGTTEPLITFASRSGNFTSHGLGFGLVTKAHEIDAVIESQIAAVPSTVAPGGSITIDGASFQPLGQVSVYLDVASGTPLATGSTGRHGSFAISATIPSSAKAGTHELIAVGLNGQRAQTTITVS